MFIIITSKYKIAFISIISMMIGLNAFCITYYSQGTAGFSNLSNWNTIPAGGGSSPVAADLTSGLHDFIIQNNHTITVDQNISLLSLVLNGGAFGGHLVIGNNTTSRNVNIAGSTQINNPGTISSGLPDAIHTLTLRGSITNNGTLDLFNSSSSATNAVFNATSSTLSGSGVFEFANFSLATTPNPSTTLNLNASVTILGNVNLPNATTLNTNLLHFVSGDWVEAGTGQLTGTGTIEFNATLSQQITADASFHNLRVNTLSMIFTGAVTINGSLELLSTSTITATSNVTHTIKGNLTQSLFSSINQTNGTFLFDGTASQIIEADNSTFNNMTLSNGGLAFPKTIVGELTVKRQFTVNNTAHVISYGIKTFGNTGLGAAGIRIDGTIDWQGSIVISGNQAVAINSNASSVNFGSAEFVSNVVGQTITFNFVSPATSIAYQFGNNFIINSGNVTISNDVTINGLSGFVFSFASACILNCNGTNNFPGGFTNYDLATTSTVTYNASFAQVVTGGVSYGNLTITNNVKTINDTIEVKGVFAINGGATANFTGFKVSLLGNITANVAGAIFNNDVDVYFRNPSAAQSLSANVTYNFNNVFFTLDNPSSNVIKTIGANLNLTGNFTATALGGSIANQLIIDMGVVSILGNGTGTFSLGEYVRVNTTGSSSFRNSMLTFATRTLNENSTIRYSNNTQYSLQLISNDVVYGNLDFTGPNINYNSKALCGNIIIMGSFLRDGGGNPILRDSTATLVEVKGNYYLRGVDYPNPNTNCTFLFSGTVQNIGLGLNSSHLPNVIFSNTGTKFFSANSGQTVFVFGNLTIEDGITVDAGNKQLNIRGDFIASGVGTSGIFTQLNTAATTFSSVNNPQTIFFNSASNFGNLNINKAAAIPANKVVNLNDDIACSGTLTLTANNAELNALSRTIRIGGNFTIGNNTIFNGSGSTIIMNGSSGTQVITNGTPSAVFHNFTFENSALKSLAGTATTFTGDILINNSTFAGNAIPISIIGNWNVINSGNFTHTNTVTFVGINQNISASNFNAVVFSNSGTKTLGGSIIANGAFTINSGVTLDATVLSHNVFIGGSYTNNGTFLVNNNTVSFIGGVKSINSGGTGAGKIFYNLEIQGTALANNTLTAPIRVNNDLIIGSGTLVTAANDVTVAGNLLVTDNSNAAYNASGVSVLRFIASSGTKQFNPGSTSLSVFRQIDVNCPGAVYEVIANNFSITSNTPLNIIGGRLNLNGRGITMTNGNVNISPGGTLSIDAGSELFLSNTASLNNNGGTLRIVGSVSQRAFVKRNGATGGYTINQTSGNLEARYYQIENTASTGFSITGGTIDGVNNLSNGIFVNGAGTQYLNLGSLALPPGFTINNTEFYTGPTFNVTKNTGSSVVTFNGSTGSLAGEAFDNDPGNVVNWIITSKKWTGLAGDNQWNTANNWSPVGIPTLIDTIYIDHTTVIPAISVNITGTNAVCARLILDSQGGTPVSLTIGSGRTLSIGENLNVLVNTTLTQTDNTSFLNIGGSYLNTGTLNNGNSTVTLTGVVGNYVLLPGSNNFFNLIVNSAGSEYLLGQNITVNNNISITAGLLDVSSSNYQITVNGNWTNASPGTFNPRSGTVLFNGLAQNISGGGPFFNLTISGTGTKSITSGSLVVNNDITINTGNILDGGTASISIRRNWINNAIGGFSHSGLGVVSFNGTANQIIDNGSASTTFNNLSFSGAGAKTLARNINVNGDFEVLAGSGTVDLSTFSVTGTPSKTFSLNGAVFLIIRGVSNFPSGFGTVNLAVGTTVRYQADGNQNVFSTTYGILDLRRNTIINNTKTATGRISVVGNLLINDVNTQLVMNNDSLILSAGFTFPASGRRIVWGPSGTFVHNGGNFTIPATYSGFIMTADPGPEFNNVLLTGAGTKTLGASVLVNGNFQVQSGIIFTMATNQLTGTPSGTLILQSGSTLNSAIPSSTGVAFPTGFGTYSLSSSSTVSLNGGTNPQRISLEPVYGNLNMTNTSTSTLFGANDTLFVAGNFATNNSTLLDNNKHFNFSGANIDIRNYIPSSTSTIVMSGGNQNIVDAAASGSQLDLNNIVFRNSGIKTLAAATSNIIFVTGNFIIESNVIVTTNRSLNFSGSNFTNSGTFNHTGGATTFSFTGSNTQTINLGASNSISCNVSFNKTSNPVNFVSNGGLFLRNQNAVPVFIINAGTTVDMGSGLTHTINGSIQNDGTWNTTNANLIFSGNIQVFLTPVFNAQNITIGGANTKTMSCPWSVNDLTINSASLVTGGFNLTCRGNFINNSVFTVSTASVFFESNDSSPKNIFVGNSVLRDVFFNSTLTSNRTYNLTATSTTFSRQLTIGTGANLNLNGNTLTLGSNNAFAEVHTIQAGGTLTLNAGSILRFNNDNGNSTLNVAGTLNAVGSSSDYVSITRSNATNRVNINVLGFISARYYIFEFLSDAGLNVTSSATVDPINNFSDGIFSNINTAGGPAKYYLILNGNIATPISNVNFNFIGTPVVGVHFNVQRTVGPFVQFNEVIGGVLGNFTFESDDNSATTGLIRWPVTLDITWTGAINRNWNIAGNWSPPQVPTAVDNAIIPLVTNNPLITSANATCKNLTITNGNLGLENGFDLVVEKDIIIGTGTNNGIVSVLNTGSEITIKGNWTRGTNGIFSNGGGVVYFAGTSGLYTINPLNSAFNSVVFNSSGAVYTINAANVSFAGSFTINDGTVNAGTAGYVFSIKGNFTNNGVFNNSIVGTVAFDGLTNQNISNATFSSIIISNPSVKTFINNATILATTLVSNGATLASNGTGVIDFKGNVTFNTGTQFNDGGLLHLFNGTTWTGNNGNILNTGGVRFNRLGAQSITGGRFNNLIFEGTGNKTVTGNIIIDGNVTAKTGIGNLNLQTFTINSSNGLGIFSVEPTVNLFIRGTSNTPSNYSGYDFAENSTTYFDAAIDQNIGNISFGNVILNSATIKYLTGNTNIKGNLTFNTSTLDVTSGNFFLTIGGNYNNNSTGSFICREGTVIFNRTAAGNQIVYNGVIGTKAFHNITIDRPIGLIVQFNNGNPILNGDLNINSGRLDIATNTVSVFGNFIISSGGQALSSGTYLFNNNTGGVRNIQTSGSVLNNVTIDAPTSTYQLLDNFSTIGNFQLLNGNFNGNGFILSLGNGNEAVNINAGTVFSAGGGGRLAFGNNVTCTVNGTINLVGSSSLPVVVTNNATGSRYSFIVNGNIAAENYLFEFMNSSGIQINNAAVIDATYSLNNGTFTNGAAGGTYLKIENAQTFTADNVSFTNNPGGGARNVSKTISSAGTVTFSNYSGVFAGSAYELDPFDKIDWIGPVILTWNGSVSSDWYNPNNWTPSSGPLIIPNSTTDVIIDFALNQPVITVDGAYTNKLTVNSGSTLIINTPFAFEPDLVVSSDLILNGNFISSGTSDTISISGNWIRGPIGNFTPGNSTVIFNSNIGSKTINNGTSFFNNVEVNGTSYYQLGANTIINGDLNIVQGTLDVTNSNFSLTVRRNWISLSNFISRNGTVNLNAISSGTFNINPGANSFNNLNISSSFGTVYTLVSNNLQVMGNTTVNSGTLNINNLSHFNGDNSGFDVLNIFGTYTLGNNGSLRNGNNASVVVNSGGSFIAVGSSLSTITRITRQTTGSYSFVINNGANVQFRFYEITHINSAGIILQTGSLINPVNNFSDGIFSNGFSGGCYLDFQNDFADFTINNVIFNAGPSVNARRLTGIGVVTFQDANGLIAGEAFEDDDASATTGLIRWTITEPVYTWTGNTSTNWHTASNWNDQFGNPAVIIPNTTINVIIPDVSSLSGNFPVISTANANCLNIQILSGANLTLQNNRNLNITGSFLNSGVFTSTAGSNSTITVGNLWGNNATFNAGISTVVLNAASGFKIINTNGFAFNNLNLNGNAVFQSNSNISINGNLNISNGTLQITNSSHVLFVGGNWTNNSNFINGNGTVNFNRNSGIQTVTNPTGEVFHNLSVSSNGAVLKTLVFANFVTAINGNLLITDNCQLNAASNVFDIKGNWTNNGLPFLSTGTVNFNGFSNQKIFRIGNETFNNLHITNSSIAGVELLTGLVISNNLDLITQGKLFFGSSAKTVELTGMAAASNTLKGGVLTLIDLSGPAHQLIIGCENPGFSGTLLPGLNSIVNYNRNNAISGSGGNQQILSAVVNYANISFTGTDNKFISSSLNISSDLFVDGSNVQIQSVNPLTSLTIGGNFTLLNGASMNDNCLNNLQLITNGNSNQTFNGNGNIFKFNSFNSTKSSGNFLLQGPSSISNMNVSNDFIIDFSSTSLFNDGGNSIEVGDDVFIGSASSSFSNFNITGEFVLNGSNENSGITISDISGNDICKAQLGGITVIAGNNTLNDIVNVMPVVGGQPLHIRGSLNIVEGINGSQFQTNGNDIFIAGDFTSYQNGYLQGNGNLEFYGSALQNLSSIGGISINQLKMNNSSLGLRVNNDISITDELNLTSGRFILNGADLTLGTNSSNASIINQNSTSYIVTYDGMLTGKLYVNMNSLGTYIFPVGDISDYTPAEVTFNSATFNNAQMEVYVMPEIHPMISGSTNYINRYWTIEPSGVSNFNYNVSYTYADADIIGSESTIYAFKYNSSGWLGAPESAADFTHGTSSSLNFATNTFTWNGLFTFSGFTGIGDGTPLPVSLLKFNAVYTGENVELTWTTLSEINCDYFEVERTTDSKSFVSVGIQKGAGSHNGKLDYKLNDENFIVGNSYYRLKQVDFDGKENYSSMVRVFIEPSNSQVVEAYFAENNLYLVADMPLNALLDISIYDMAGRKLAFFDLSNTQAHNIKIDLSNLPSGLYFCNFGQEIFRTKKFVKY